LKERWYADQEVQSGTDHDPAGQIEVLVANGQTTPQACREAEITGADVLPLAQEYGGFYECQTECPSAQVES
jgi:hypothetical protein